MTLKGHYALRLICLEDTHRSFLADRTNGRAYATVLRPSVVVVCRCRL